MFSLGSIKSGLSQAFNPVKDAVSSVGQGAKQVAQAASGTVRQVGFQVKDGFETAARPLASAAASVLGAVPLGRSLREPERQAGWTQSPQIIRQDTLRNGNVACGGAVGAMLLRAAGVQGSAQQLVDQYFRGGANLTFHDLSVGLESAGLKTLPTGLTWDFAARTVREGNKVIARVDPQKFGMGGGGQAHYLLLDSVDSQGNFRALDPASGKAFTLSSERLRGALVTDFKSGPLSNTGLLAVYPKSGSSSSRWIDLINHPGLGGAREVASRASGTGPGGGSKTKDEQGSVPL